MRRGEARAEAAPVAARGAFRAQIRPLWALGGAEYNLFYYGREDSGA